MPRLVLSSLLVTTLVGGVAGSARADSCAAVVNNAIGWGWTGPGYVVETQLVGGNGVKWGSYAHTYLHAVYDGEVGALRLVGDATTFTPGANNLLINGGGYTGVRSSRT